MLQKVKSGFIDKLGGTLATLCAIHCMALPILLSFGTIWSHGAVEVFFLVSAFIFSVTTVYRSLRLNRLNYLVISLFAIGLIALVLSVIFHAHSLSAVGGVLLALAHFFNYRQQHRTCNVVSIA